MSLEQRGSYIRARNFTLTGMVGIVALSAAVILYSGVKAKAVDCVENTTGRVIPPDEETAKQIRTQLAAESPDMPEPMLTSMVSTRFNKAVSKWNYKKYRCWEEASLISSAKRFFHW